MVIVLVIFIWVDLLSARCPAGAGPRRPLFEGDYLVGGVGELGAVSDTGKSALFQQLRPVREIADQQ
jgi:hypothetical protein